MGPSCPWAWCVVQAGEGCAAPAVAAISGDDWDKVIEISSPCWGSQARELCPQLFIIQQHCQYYRDWGSPEQCPAPLAERGVSFVTRSGSRAIPSQQRGELAGHCGCDRAARAGPALLHSLLQPARPVHSQAWEHWSLGGIFCPKSGLFGQGWSGKERQRHPYANRGELLLQSSFQLVP